MKKWISAFAFIGMGFTQDAMAESSRFVSEYTSLTDCKSIIKPGKADADGPSDFMQNKCPGRDGYSVYVEGGDTRSWLTLKKGKIEIRLPTGAGSMGASGVEGELAFPYVVQTKLEWRYQIIEGHKKRTALIYRMGGSEAKAYFLDGKQKEISLLYVVHLAHENTCAIGHTNSNEGAHQIADSGKSCP